MLRKFLAETRLETIMFRVLGIYLPPLYIYDIRFTIELQLCGIENRMMNDEYIARSAYLI